MGDKLEIVEALCRKNYTDNIIFIDDNLENNISIKKLGISTYLAAWGYTHEGIINNSMEMGINILTLDDLHSIA